MEFNCIKNLQNKQSSLRCLPCGELPEYVGTDGANRGLGVYESVWDHLKAWYFLRSKQSLVKPAQTPHFLTLIYLCPKDSG